MPDLTDDNEQRRREATERGRALAEAHAQQIGLPGKDSGRRAARRYVPLIIAAVAAIGGGCYWLLQPSAGLSDAEVREEIIKESVAAYQADGRPCPCPFNLRNDGKPCGDFSAYSKPGAAVPVCYAKDVNDAMLRDWRQRH